MEFDPLTHPRLIKSSHRVPELPLAPRRGGAERTEGFPRREGHGSAPRQERAGMVGVSPEATRRSDRCASCETAAAEVEQEEFSQG